jgi:hypothetical protein
MKVFENERGGGGRACKKSLEREVPGEVTRARGKKRKGEGGGGFLFVCLFICLFICLYKINIGHARKPSYGRRRTDVLLPPLTSVLGPNLWFVRGYYV